MFKELLKINKIKALDVIAILEKTLKSPINCSSKEKKKSHCFVPFLLSRNRKVTFFVDFTEVFTLFNPKHTAFSYSDVYLSHDTIVLSSIEQDLNAIYNN